MVIAVSSINTHIPSRDIRNNPLTSSHINELKGRLLRQAVAHVQPELLFLELDRVTNPIEGKGIFEKLSLLKIVDCLPHTERKILGPYSSDNVPVVLESLEGRAPHYLKPVTGDSVHGGNGVVRVSQLRDGFTLSTGEATEKEVLNRKEFEIKLHEYFARFCGKMMTTLFSLEKEIPIPLWDGKVWEIRFVVGYDSETSKNQVVGDYAKVNFGTRSNLAQGGSARHSRQVLLSITETRGVSFRDERADAAYGSGRELALSAAKLLRQEIVSRVERMVGFTPPPHLIGPHRFAVDVAYHWKEDRLVPMIMEIQYPNVGLEGLQVTCPRVSLDYAVSLDRSGRNSMARVEEWIYSVRPDLTRHGRQ